MKEYLKNLTNLMKKMLFLWSTSMWDRIASIPYLLKKRDEWVKIYLLEYWKWLVNYLFKTDDIYKLYKENNLYEWLFVIPKNPFKLLIFIIKNFHKFEYCYAPTYTFFNNIRWLLFWKKWEYTFKSLNDNSKYSSFVYWMMNDTKLDFHCYSEKIKLIYDKNYKDLLWDYKKNVTIFVWPYTWSLKEEERKKIFNYLSSEWYGIVLIWWEREKWILEVLEWWKSNITNLIGKTNFSQICAIIKNANITISANWWIMWLSYLLNKNNISFSTVSWNMMDPPCDNINSFHLRNRVCSLPCEWRIWKDDFNK